MSGSKGTSTQPQVDRYHVPIALDETSLVKKMSPSMANAEIADRIISNGIEA